MLNKKILFLAVSTSIGITGCFSTGQNESVAVVTSSSPVMSMQMAKPESFDRKRLVKNSHLSQKRMISQPDMVVDRETYNHFDDNKTKLVSEESISTFSIDVDTGAYSNVRRMINGGYLPRKDAVRIEELVNYFSYDYPLPKNDQAFNVVTELGPTPWNKNSKLLHIGIKGLEVERSELPASNLVFLVDVSGSMTAPNKLGLLKSSLKLLTNKMRSKDTISLVVYAGASGVVLEPTNGDNKMDIIMALDKLSAGGSTNGASGIELAYNMAKKSFIEGGINRVLIATDGDFNVGNIDFESLKNMVEEKREMGISLTTLGFGGSNYNDHLMEQLADSGNGNYSYIDTLNEAQKVLVDEMSSTLMTIAKDVKIQVEFNPNVVKEYRLIGYENRQLNREDFNNDKVDAGEIGAGHTVTALYEVVLNGDQGQFDTKRYGIKHKKINVDKTLSNEMAWLRIRHKEPTGTKSKLIEKPVYYTNEIAKLKNTSDNYRFSAAVAGYGQLLRGAKYTGAFNFDDVLALARKSRGEDNYGYRGDFIELANLTNSLSATSSVVKKKVQSVKTVQVMF